MTNLEAQMSDRPIQDVSLSSQLANQGLITI